MCIVFIRVDADYRLGSYKLVIAANRDEYFNRPSLSMNFLQDHSHILAGLDMVSKTKDGMWLGITKSGRFGFLTNHLTPGFTNEVGKPRGTIVKNFLLSQCSTGEFITERLVNDISYKPFNFIGGQLHGSKRNIDVCYFSNKDSASPYHLSDGDFAVSGAKLSKPWKKNSHGLKNFKEVLKNSTTADHKELAEMLFNNVLSDRTNLYPDWSIEEQCNSSLGRAELKSYCSVMMTGLEKYGTREQTVILVDKNNQVFVFERSLSHDELRRRKVWKRETYTFLLEP